MVPVVELRGAIPTGFFGYDLPIVQVCIISAIANLIPVPIIYFFARKVLVWGKDKKVIGKFFTFCLEKGEKGGKKLSGKTGIGLFIGLALFVGIPLPGTGAWTGTLVASLHFPRYAAALYVPPLLWASSARAARRRSAGSYRT